MHTLTLEGAAEDLIAHKLGRAGVIVATPRADQNGTDLLALLQVEDGARFCRIQCKGRNVRPGMRNHVNIHKHYATNGFIVFLFVETGEPSHTLLYCFFREDLTSEWSTGPKYFRLNLDPLTFRKQLSRFEVTEQRIELVKQRIRESNPTEEIKMLKISGYLAAVEEGSDTAAIIGTVVPN